MKTIKYSILALLINILFISSSFATHVIGGDFHIQWVSQTANGANYHIKLRFYRDNYYGGPDLPNDIEIGVYDAVNHSLETTKTLYPTSDLVLPLGDVCYSPPVTTQVEEGVYESTTNLYLPNNSNGYYLNAQVFARNSLAINVSGPGTTNGTMVWFAMIPNPADGQNSSPDFGDYPLDSYFCLGNEKYIQWPVTDADGDSLVYSLVEPLNAHTNSNGTYPGQGSYPFYPSLVFQGNYSLSNYIGGQNPMTIDSCTGEIMAAPDMVGHYTFAVRVEEYRNGMKIGEVRRDIQYATLQCAYWTDPNINIADSLAVYVDDSICFDLYIEEEDLDANIDTQYLHITSSNFDLQGNYVSPNIVGSNSTYNNWMNSGNSITFPNLGVDSNLIGPGNAITGFGQIPLRYCWVPECKDLDSVFKINLVGVAIDTCEYGVDTITISGDNINVHMSQKQLAIHVINTPPPTLLNVPDTISVSLGETMCIDLLAEDSVNINDTLFILPYSANFDFETTFVPPTNDGSGSYYYEDFITPGNTLSMDNYISSGFIPGAIEKVGLRFCWTTDCDYVFQKEFDLEYNVFSSACGADTLSKNSFISVIPPVGDVDALPNVFTPNGDYVNDHFKLKGTSDPCYDFMMVKIYNRWGMKVFESEDSNFEWDGTNQGNGICEAGTYYVMIDGSLGSTYDIESGERMPNLVKDEYFINLFR